MNIFNEINVDIMDLAEENEVLVDGAWTGDECGIFVAVAKKSDILIQAVEKNGLRVEKVAGHEWNVYEGVEIVARIYRGVVSTLVSEVMP